MTRTCVPFYPRRLPGSELVVLNRRVVVVASSLRAAPETRGRARGRDPRTFERSASRMGRINAAEVEGRGPYQVGTQDSFACAREPTRAVEHFVD